MAKRHKAKQLTLFDCAEQSETEPSTPKRARIEPESVALPAPTNVPACSDQQTNQITVNSPSGPTMTVLNSVNGMLLSQANFEKQH